MTSLLATNSYVSVFVLDFSKAFDTVRHSTLLDKTSNFPLPDHAYNWLVDYFQDHEHCTKTGAGTSRSVRINASVIQGSSLGPAAYAVNASDLRTKYSTNFLFKFADDTDLVVPSSNDATKIAELESISQWTKDNNLTLNHSKSAEIVFWRPKSKISEPDPVLGIPQVKSLKMLGVTLSENFSMVDHVSGVLTSCVQSLYALKMLRQQGLNNASIYVVFQAKIMSKLLYASPAWFGFAKGEEIGRIDAFIRRCVNNSYASPDMKDFASLCSDADDKLFACVVAEEDHILHRLLPEKKDNNLQS